MTRFFSLLFALLTIAPATNAAETLFSLHGSNTVGANLAPALVEGYLKAQGMGKVVTQESGAENEKRITAIDAGGKSVEVTIAAHGSTTAFLALGDGRADIGMASRPIKNNEVQKLRALGDLSSPQGEHVIAIDGLAIIVNRDNPVQQLSLEQVAQIFSGQIRNWREVGGPNLNIEVHARDEKSGTWDTFKSLVLKKDHQLVSDAARYESNDALSATVSHSAAAIGFTALASVRDSKALAVYAKGTRALEPTVSEIATEDYPLARRLYLYTAEQQPQRVKPFIDFVLGHAGQRIVEQEGFISQNIRSIEQEVGSTPADYQRLVGQAKRLSVNFRFAEGSAELDNKAVRDVQRLAAFMQRPENSQHEVLLIGFGDDKGNPERALILSRMRAVMVKSALRKYNVHAAPVQGMGEALAVASNNSSDKLRNQRVEVWLR